MKYGDKGTKFYIILRGSVSVRIPSLVNKHFSFKSLLQFIVEHEQWIIENDKFEAVWELIQTLMPELIWKTYTLKFNYKLARKILKAEKVVDSQLKYPDVFPGFQYLKTDDPYDDAAPKDSKNLKFDIMLEVASLGVGIGFGELALMNNVPRSATIKTIEDCQFAVINKADFKETMDKVYK